MYRSHCAIALLLLIASFARAGYVEDRADGTTVIHVKVYELPDATKTDAFTRAEVAGVAAFQKQFAATFAKKYAAKYKADPDKYGRHNWDRVEVQLHPFLQLEGTGIEPDSLAIAGGVAPDVLYVNFRKSDFFIQNQFLYPLDNPEDGYLTSMTPEQLEFRIHPKIWPVIRRRGPDGQTRVWAIPYGGALGTVLLYRKDLFDAKGLKYPDANWTWDDLLHACRRIADPANGRYGLIAGQGPAESWFWFNYLWAAGGEVMEQDPATGQWRYVFDSREAAESVDFYLRLNLESWTDAKGTPRRGYTMREYFGLDYWERGQVGMRMDYIDGKLFSTINPEVTGMAPTPLGPRGHRGAELNSRMMGLSSQIKHPAVRDAAWEYMRFYDSEEACAIKTRVLVEGGFGPFLNPAHLRRFGYPEIERLAPAGWSEIYDISLASGRPEPYGPNASYIYQITTPPLHQLEAMWLANELPADREARLTKIQEVLHKGVQRANEENLGILPPGEREKRDRVAWVVIAVLVITFVVLLRRVVRSFQPAHLMPAGRKRRYTWAYILLIPALATIVLWQYTPLLRGSVMAFQDYKLMGPPTWIGVSNFGDLLFDAYWWHSVWNALRYSFLVMSLTFIPPILLAILLQEVPRGSLTFRIIFYLPGVLSGIVTTILWRQFYSPDENGMLNAVVMNIPAIGYLAIGAVVFAICLAFTWRLAVHNAWLPALGFVAAGVLLAGLCVEWAWPIMFPQLPGVKGGVFAFPVEPYRWLSDPSLAMLSCVLPLLWAGIGPGCLIYLAALKGIPDDFYEAADLDGANLIDKILFVVFPILKPLILINFIGVFIASWYGAEANILPLTAGQADTEVAGLHILYKAFRGQKFGAATAMAWVLAFMLIGFTAFQLRTISRLEFRTTGKKD